MLSYRMFRQGALQDLNMMNVARRQKLTSEEIESWIQAEFKRHRHWEASGGVMSRRTRRFYDKLVAKRVGIYKHTVDIRFGLHSGIPKCCILAFLTRTGVPRASVGYKICRECYRADRVIKLHMCNDACEPLNSLPKGDTYL